MIAGLEEPTAGDIRIAGHSIVALPPHERNVAVAFENYALFPPLTVEENIAFGMRARKEAKPRSVRVKSRSGLASRHCSTASRAVFPVVKSSASAWHGRLCASPQCYCSTNRCRILTHLSASKPGVS